MATPAGFYPDPDPTAPQGRERWWDGTAWTATVQAPSSAPVAPAPPVPPTTPVVPDYSSAPTHPAAPAYPAVPAYQPAPAYQSYATQQQVGQPWAAQPYQQPFPQPPQQFADPTADLARERAMSTFAYLSVLIVGALYAALAIVSVTHNHHVATIARAFQRQNGFLPDAVTLNQLDGSNRYLAISLAITPLIVVVSVPMLMWIYRAATLAQRLHYPAKLGPGLGVGGWFIPICNLWFPYQSVRDTLPPGDSRRTLVKQWWTVNIGWEIVFGVLNLIASVSSTQGDYSTTFATIAIVIDLVFIVAWVATFRRVQQGVEANHKDAIDQANARAISVAQ